MPFVDLATAAARRHGVVDAALARSVDECPRQLRRRAGREGWAQPYPGAWVIPGFGVTPATRAVCAVVSIGGPAALTGMSALAHADLLPSFPSTIDVAIPANRRRPQLDRVNVHFTSAWPPALRPKQAVAVTDVACSLALLGGRLDPRGLRGVAFDAVGRRLMTVQDLQRELDLRGRFTGRGELRRLVGELVGDGSESGFEFGARDRLHRRGLRPLQDQPVVVTGRSTRRIDIAFEGEVGIDCHSLRHHASPADLESDAVRDNEIAALDRWLLLRLTFRMFHLRWEPFEAQLRRCLVARGAIAS